ncbi:hypothetical protein QL996_07355 [Planococcus sp. APC 4015]|nr:hypothetical protein [Planococcus sp. APC 4015]
MRDITQPVGPAKLRRITKRHAVASGVLTVVFGVLLVVLLLVGLPFDSGYVWLFWFLIASIVYQGLWAAWGIHQLRTTLASEIASAEAKTPSDSAEEAPSEMNFWDGGRLAYIDRGPWSGRLLFMYPDSRPPWWTFVIDPSPYENAPGDHYADEPELAVRLTEEWGLRWIPRGDDEQRLEATRFDWRRMLTGASWNAAPPPRE